MHAAHAPHPRAHGSGYPAKAIDAGLTTWRALAVDLPLRLAAETMRFTGRRFQAQADHLAALARCGSLNQAVELQTAFVSKSLADYQNEAAILSDDVTEIALAKAA